ncbi:MAG: hypothetical protein FWF08_00565 [Oscillospiraceae bacterium]|nr:hypothetical protein [Oscillospiraceae bacterium]
MKKDHTRDYVTAAFAYYAETGRSERETLKEAEISDIMAVQKTLRALENKPEVLEAVRTVYFDDPGRVFGKGEISRRVVKASMEIPASERQVYRWLNDARRVFSLERGMRI